GAFAVAAFDAFFHQGAFFGALPGEFCGVFRVVLGVIGGADDVHDVAGEFHLLVRPHCRPARSEQPISSLPYDTPSPYQGDNLSRLALRSELIDCHSPCGIRGLAEGGRMAPILPEKAKLKISPSI